MLVVLIPVAFVFGSVLIWALGGIYVAYGEPAHYFGPSCIGLDDDYWFDVLLVVAMLVFAIGALRVLCAAQVAGRVGCFAEYARGGSGGQGEVCALEPALGRQGC